MFAEHKSMKTQFCNRKNNDFLIYFLTFVFTIAFVLPSLAKSSTVTLAFSNTETNYTVFTQDDDFLCELTNVEVGDVYISKSFKQYQIYLVDEISKTAKAKFLKQIDKPNITKKGNQSIDTTVNKKIALYLTHNAESYLIGDGTDSIYGKGGVHDIAKQLAFELKQKGVSANLSETLHLPHDTLAYARSKKTAEKLLLGKPDAIFDIHRDGASRRTYAKVKDGKEHSTVRIVVGQANPNQQKNLTFAMWLMAVAETMHPWLFLDIYFAKGHYNQNLYEKSLLFEMGTHTIEKDLVMQTVKPLASVIYTTLYNTTVNSEGNLVVGGSEQNSQTVNQFLNSSKNKNSFQHFSAAIAVVLLVGFFAFFVFQWRRKHKP